MYKKRNLLLIFTISILLIASINGNKFQYAISQDDLPFEEEVDTAHYGNLYGAGFQIKQPSEEFFHNVDPESTEIVEVYNASIGRFIVTFTNEGNDVLYLKSFDVSLYNSSANSDFPEVKFYYYYPPAEEVLKNMSRTLVFDRILPFRLFDEVYKVFFQITHTTFANTTERTMSNSFNFTLLSLEPDLLPPDLIVWTWMFISFLIVLHFSIGYYGNRKSKTNKSKN